MGWRRGGSRHGSRATGGPESLTAGAHGLRDKQQPVQAHLAEARRLPRCDVDGGTTPRARRRMNLERHHVVRFLRTHPCTSIHWYLPPCYDSVPQARPLPRAPVGETRVARGTGRLQGPSQNLTRTFHVDHGRTANATAKCDDVTISMRRAQELNPENSRCASIGKPQWSASPCQSRQVHPLRIPPQL